MAEGKVRISKFDQKDLYLEEGELSSGKVDMLTHKENSRTFAAGQIFGDLSTFDGKPWPGLFAFAIDGPATIIEIDKHRMDELYSSVEK